MRYRCNREKKHIQQEQVRESWQHPQIVGAKMLKVFLISSTVFHRDEVMLLTRCYYGGHKVGAGFFILRRVSLSASQLTLQYSQRGWDFGLEGGTRVFTEKQFHSWSYFLLETTIGGR